MPNPNDPNLKAQIKGLNEQLHTMESNIADAEGRGEDVTAMRKEFEQLSQERVTLKRQSQGARQGNVDAQRSERRAAAKQRRGPKAKVRKGR